MAWLAERLRDFVDLNPEFETAVDRLAKWLARLDSDGDADPDGLPRSQRDQAVISNGSVSSPLGARPLDGGGPGEAPVRRDTS